MLEDAAGIRRVVLACGTVDLRKGIDGLATIIGDRYGQNPFEKGTLFLFCGKRSDRCKGLLWMGTGFLLLYKRFEDGRLSWPRNIQEAAELTEDQYRYLMTGLNPLDPRIKDAHAVVGRRIHFSRLVALALLGRDVQHARAVEPAQVLEHLDESDDVVAVDGTVVVEVEAREDARGRTHEVDRLLLHTLGDVP